MAEGGVLSTLARLETELVGRLCRPGDDGYAAATSPRNASGSQAPLAVVSVVDSGDIIAAVRWAADAGLRVAVQATGHGAAGTIANDVLLLDTSGLGDVALDSSRAIARVGAGVRSAALSAVTDPAGLLAAVGTAPDVGVVGYTAYGGVGWLTRAFGMASGSLLSVDFVNGQGVLSRADGDALWAFRGGGGVGIAVSMELALHRVEDLWGGYALWPLGAADRVIAAWSELQTTGPPQLSTVISTLRSPMSPEPLCNRTALYLGAASPDGQSASAAMRRILAGLPPAVISTFGDCDAERLAQIHFDPPIPVPAIGEGRWLGAGAQARASEIVTAALTGRAHRETGIRADTDLDEPALAEVELRHLSSDAPVAPGALTTPPGEYLLHAVGLVPDADARTAVQAELAKVLAAAAPDDTGQASAPFRDGRGATQDALAPDAWRRLTELRARHDPNGTLVFPRPLTGDGHDRGLDPA
jgi:FAD/FMN-containing dehydrogenase